MTLRTFANIFFLLAISTAGAQEAEQDSINLLATLKQGLLFSKKAFFGLGNDFKEAGIDAREIMIDISTTCSPVINAVIQEIKEPFLDLPDVMEEINETYTTIKSFILVKTQPAQNVYASARDRIVQMRSYLPTIN